jgi:benzoate/toluate 1,2-dioxygenase reductase subunit
MAYRIALNFEDGATRIIACNPGETVLKAAYRQQVNLPVDCSDGVCGTCKCRAESGTYDLGDDYIDDALTQDEAEEGLVLTCQMMPSSDCVVAVPVPTSACKIRPAQHNGTVIRAEQVSPSTLVLELALDKPEALDFLPGQYVNLTIPGCDDTRAYSFSSAPGDATARFLIRNVPGGRMSGWLTGSAQPGDAMRFTGPNGSFFLRPALRPILMLAGARVWRRCFRCWPFWGNRAARKGCIWFTASPMMPIWSNSTRSSRWARPSPVSPTPRSSPTRPVTIRARAMSPPIWPMSI